VERKAIILRRLGNISGIWPIIMVAPKLFVFKHNLFKVFKSYHHWINLAELTKFEELNS